MAFPIYWKMLDCRHGRTLYRSSQVLRAVCILSACPLDQDTYSSSANLVGLSSCIAEKQKDCQPGY